MESKKIKIGSQANCMFELSSLKNWDEVVENIALVAMGAKLRAYIKVDVIPKVRSHNTAVLKYTCQKECGGIDEYFLNFDILGSFDLGYDSEVSKVWRECLEANFGKEYREYVARKLLKAKEDYSC